MSYLILIKTEIYKKLKPNIVFAVLISALSHDVDHPGNTNSYEINSMSRYARLYNDVSVLENHQCSLTFELLEESKVLEQFKDDEFKEIRKTIIQSILFTDMSKHNDVLDKFNNFNYTYQNYSIDEQISIASVLVHFADLSGPIKDFDIVYEWSQRISLEYYDQAIKEEIEGLPTLLFMKVRDNLCMCMNEISFIKNVSIPTWTLFVNKFSNMKFILEKININLMNWEKIEQQQQIYNSDINDFSY
jgi:hypothetical protein